MSFVRPSFSHNFLNRRSICSALSVPRLLTLIIQRVLSRQIRRLFRGRKYSQSRRLLKERTNYASDGQVARRRTNADMQMEPVDVGPPRCWWLKRLGIAYALFIAFIACVYAAWTIHSHRVWRSAIAEVQKRGEPILPQDFFPERPPPDGDNAVTKLKEASELLDRDRDWSRQLSDSVPEGIGSDYPKLTQ